MVLAYLGDSVTEEELLVLFDGTEFGTPASRMTRLGRMGYDVEIGRGTFDLLRSKLELGLPSIALVHTAFLDYWTESTRHAVVVVGLDDEHAYLNDPAFESAPQTVPLEGFLKWTRFPPQLLVSFSLGPGISPTCDRGQCT
jgi:ABC-type bacteriocin/lantibiotic exporter with double-glycine peptidase domain